MSILRSAGCSALCCPHAGTQSGILPSGSLLVFVVPEKKPDELHISPQRPLSHRLNSHLI